MLGTPLGDFFQQAKVMQIQQVIARCLIDNTVRPLVGVYSIALAGISEGVRQKRNLPVGVEPAAQFRRRRPRFPGNDLLASQQSRGLKII